MRLNDLLPTNSDASLDLLCTISSIAPSHVSGNTLPLLFASLPDRAPPREAEAERIKYWRTLASLKKLCTQPDLFETLVVRLSTKLDLLCLPFATPTPPDLEPEVTAEAAEDLEPAAAYAHSLLKTLADVLQAKIELGHTDVVKYIDRLVPRLYNLFIYTGLHAETRVMVATDLRLLAVAAQIITLVMQTLSVAYVLGFAWARRVGTKRCTGDKKRSLRRSSLRTWTVMYPTLRRASRRSMRIGRSVH